MAEENSMQGTKKQFMKTYEEMVIMKKDYSFIIIDKSAKIDWWFYYCEQGKKLFNIML